MSSPTPTPDFRTVISQFEALTADWGRRAAEVSEAIADSGGSETTAEFTLRAVAGGRITELTFTDEARSASPVRLRESILDALARLTVAGNRRQAVQVAQILDSPELATGIRSAVPQDVADRVHDDDIDPVPAPFVGRSAPVYPATAQEVLDWAAATDADTVVSADIAEMMSDVDGWNPGYLGRFDPLTAQADLESEIARISAQASDVASSLADVRVEKSDVALTVTVNGAGRLVDLTFRPGFRSMDGTALTTRFSRLYAEATQEASTTVLAQLDATGLAGPDDPSRGLVDAARRDAQQTLDRDTSA